MSIRILAYSSCKDNAGQKTTESQLAAFDRLKEKESNINQTVFITAEGGLSMREKPSINTNKLTTIPDKSEVFLLEENGDLLIISGKSRKWSKAEYKGNVGCFSIFQR